MGKGKNKAKDKASGNGSKDPAEKAVKKLRKAGKKALKLVDQPAISEIAAAAMMAAAAALSEGKSNEGRANEGKRSKRTDNGEDGSGAIDAEAGKLAETLKALAIDVARRTLESWEAKASGARTKQGGTGGDEAA